MKIRALFGLALLLLTALCSAQSSSINVNPFGIAIPNGYASTYQRTEPSGFPQAIPIKLLAINGIGNVVTSPSSAITAFMAYYPALMTGGNCTVNSTTGVNSVAAGNTNFATLAYALRTVTTCTHIRYTKDTVEGIPPDLRDSDASQIVQQAKIIYGNGYNVIFRIAGPDPTTTTWTQDGTYPNTWCSPTNWTAAGASAVRTLRNDVLDDFNLPKQFKIYATHAELNASVVNGMHWINAPRTLCLNMQGNVEALKSNLKVLFTNAGSTSRVFVTGAQLGLDSVILDGVQINILDSGSRRPGIWTHNVKLYHPIGKGYDITGSGDTIVTKGYIYASEADGINGFMPSITGPGLIQVVNSQIIKTGDKDTFIPDGTFGTRQSISAHGGTSHVSFGNILILSNGQAIGDTTIAANDDRSWIVASRIGPPSGIAPIDSIAIGGVAGTRIMWLDTDVVIRDGSRSLQIDAGGTVYVYRTPMDVVNGGPPIAYTPNAP